jgi:hypothetical protein
VRGRAGGNRASTGEGRVGARGVWLYAGLAVAGGGGQQQAGGRRPTAGEEWGGAATEWEKGKKERKS